MNFFEHQAKARRRTGWLLALFALAVIGIAAAVWGLVALGLGAEAFTPGVIGGTLAGVGGLVGLGSLYRTLSLSAGGSAVASQLGGRLLDPAAARDPLERRLLNVVEEMALASGVPVPPVYVMDNEPGINAFAAGKTTGDAVIGVTRGALENLSRDELQGVVAHEFSHILNGDMRLNIRLIGLLHGILLIALAGRLMIEVAGRSSRSSSKGNSAIVVGLFGLGLLLIGSIGAFFGNLIKAAVSRQREFLADASAVQFTRHPEGIAGALKKIGALSSGSLVRTQGAGEISHMFFADGLRRFLGGILATHPPLVRRIQAIEPGFDGDFAGWLAAQPRRGLPSEPPEGSQRRKAGSGPLPAIPGLPQLPGFPGAAAAGFSGGEPAGSAESRETGPLPLAASLTMCVGGVEPSAGHAVREDLSNLPESVRAACQEMYGAATLLTALIFSSRPAIRREQIEQTAQTMGDEFAADSEKLALDLAAVTPARRLPLLDLLAPPLRALSLNQYAGLARLVRALMELDSEISLFEFAVHRSLMRHLDQHFGLQRPPRGNRRSLARLSPEIRVLLGFLAVSNGAEDGGASAYAQAVSLLPELPEEDRVLPPPSLLRLDHLDNALDALAELEPISRGRLVEACAAAVLADGQLLPEEIVLIRAIASSLDCPIPPVIVRGVAA